MCEPPIAANSSLSKNALRLLHSAQLTDMEFEVHTVASVISGNSCNTGTTTNYNIDREGLSMQSHKSNAQVHIFRAHRVLVAARCECFKKALMSGMQESITRYGSSYSMTMLIKIDKIAFLLEKLL